MNEKTVLEDMDPGGSGRSCLAQRWTQEIRHLGHESMRQGNGQEFDISYKHSTKDLIHDDDDDVYIQMY